MNWSQQVVDKLPSNPCQCSVKLRSAFILRDFMHKFFRHVGLKYQYITPVALPPVRSVSL